MQVASDGQGEAREANVNTRYELISWVEAGYLQDNIQVLSPVGGVRIAEG
jgi:hypothetical protein